MSAHYLTPLLFPFILMILVRVVCAPDTPAMSPEWLEEFLAFDWKKASDLDQRLADYQAARPRDISPLEEVLYGPVRNSEIPESLKSPFSPPTADSQASSSSSDALSRVGPSSLGHIAGPRDLHVASSSTAGQTRMHSWPFQAQNQHGSFMTTRASLPFEPPPAYLKLLEGGGIKRLMRHKSMSRDGKLPLELLVSRYSPINPPYSLFLPMTFRWLPSSQIMDETVAFLRDIRRDLVQPENMASISTRNLPIGAELKATDFFKVRNKIYLVRLPSQQVLLKFFVTHKIDRENRLAFTMTVWTLNVENGGLALSLRGVWGVREKVLLTIRDTFVPAEYSVKGIQSQYGKYFAILERDLPGIATARSTNGHPETLP